MTAPSPGATTSTGATTGGGYTISKPAGVVSGDLWLIFALWYDSGTVTHTRPTGFTLWPSSAVTVTSPNTILGDWSYRKCDGSEGASVSGTFSGSVYYDVASIRVSGNDTTTPTDGNATTNSGNGTAVTTTALTTTGADRLILIGHGGYTNALSVNYTGTTIAITFDSVDYIVSKAQAVAGSTGAIAATRSGGASDAWLNSVIAVASPSGGAASPLPPRSLVVPSLAMTQSAVW